NVSPEPTRLKVENAFRPDIHPVDHIPEKDIIGELTEEVHYIVNGAGDEVGRFFQGSEPKVGLIGDGFRALTRLAEQIQKAGALRDTTSFEFVKDAVFEWAQEKHCKQNTDESLTQHVCRRANEEIRDFEIWIPLHLTYLESPLALGPVTLRTITRE